MGDVVRRMRRILGLHPIGYLVLAIVVVVIPPLLGPLLLAPFRTDLQIAARSGQSATTAMYVSVFLLGAVPEIVKFVGNLVLTATVAIAAWRDAQGVTPDFGACLRGGLRVFPPMLLLSVLTAVSVMLGSLLLLVPGMILAFMWFVVNQVYAVERPGITAAYGRSRFLTSGYRWTLVGIALLYSLAVAVVFGLGAVATYVVVRQANPAGVWVVFILGAVGTILLNVVTASGLAAIYIELRRAKDGFLSRDLIDAFT